MHILYVSADQGIPVFGCKGASVHVQEMIRAFIARGAQVTLMSPRLEDRPPDDLRGVSTIELPRSCDKDPTGRARESIAVNRVIADAAAGLEPCDLIYERHSLYTDAPMQVARQRGIPGILEVNAPLIDEQARHRSLALAEEASQHARNALSSARVVSVVSPQVADYATACGAPAARVHVLENAVNPQRFPPTPRPAGPFTVGFLGTLKPWHDVATLVDSFALLCQSGRDARLLIIGDGPERQSLEQRIEAHGLGDRVAFTGALRPDEVPSQLARLHVAVAPYQRNQPFYFSPLKIYEYMAAGLPVVASRVGHLDGVIHDGRNGLLCEPDDARAMATVLTRLADDPAMANALGDTARQDVLTRHNWDAVAGRVLALAGAGQTLTALS